MSGETPVCADCGMAHSDPIEIDDHGTMCDGPYDPPPAPEAPASEEEL